MRAYGVIGMATLALSACRTAPDPTQATPPAYKGIAKIQILAKGME